jgi:excisionase family DNA binding protein
MVSRTTLSDRLLLTIDDWCLSTGMSRSKAYREINQGRLRALKIGPGKAGGVRIRPDDAQAYIEALPTKATA